MLSKTETESLSVSEVLNVYEKHKGSDKGLKTLDPVYHDAYKSLQQNHANFIMQYKEMLFASMEEYTKNNIFDKQTIMSILKNAKDEMSSRIALSSDPKRTIEHVVVSVDQFLNGDEVDMTVPFVLYMESLYEQLKTYESE